MTAERWTVDELRSLAAARELEIAVRAVDGTLRPWTPIWVVCVGDGVYVRTWYRRDTGWYGAARRTRRASVRVPGLHAEATIEDLAGTSAAVTADVDAAYMRKYGSAGAASMVTPTAQETTLRLVRADDREDGESAG